MRNLIPIYIFSFILLVSCSHSHKEEDEHDEDHHHSGIVLEPKRAKAFGIEYETVSPGTFHDVIKTSGVIEPSSSDLYSITARKSGIITLSNGIGIGSPVNSGERIASISAEGVQGGDVTQASIANLESAKAEYERLKPLYEEKLVTASVFKEAERVYNEAKALVGKGRNGSGEVLTSPAAGSIQNLFVKSGDFVDVGTPVAVIAKNSNLVLRADLPARESKHIGEISTANFIPEGADASISMNDVDGRKISGNTSSASNGYIPVYFSFTGNPLSFPGGYAEVYLICRERAEVISVPRDALVEIQGNKYVYVAEDEDEYEKRLVKTGASDGRRIEILQGLEEGDKVVSKGASIIRMAEVSAIAPPSHSHNH